MIGTAKRLSFPALDALRGLCFLAVFGCHTFHSVDPAVITDPVYRFVSASVFGPGALGVNVFFSLSGFLITFLLIQEERTNGRIDVPRFWLRRILRIWPLYFTVVVLGFVVVPWIKQQAGVRELETAEPWHYLLFISNLAKASGYEPASSSLSVLWSIAVEEQFYLVWPVLLMLAGMRRSPWACIGLIGASILFRALNPDISMQLWHTFSCMGDLATGALGAYVLASEKGQALISRAGPVTSVLWYASTLILFFFVGPAQEMFGGMAVYPFIFAVSATGTILLQCAGGHQRSRLPSRGALPAIGRISYGLYCLHMLAVLAVLQVMQRVGLGHEVWHVLVIQSLAALLLSIVLAALSHRYLERPFLRLKDRFAYIVRG
ncbi:MAG: acyltransferase [Flavobacteriales bacterium]|nr:acyltransferase [Flavobacteriales bacterium]